MGFTFSKEERLCSKVLIDRLYTDGHRLMAFPFSVQWMLVADPSSPVSLLPSCQVMIVAPKRKFRHAVDRNRVRRLTRECYRLRKHTLYAFLEENNLHLVFSMVYIHNEIMTYDQLGHKMDKLLDSLQRDIEKNMQP
jgi:ribonuclease P protein component